jgi:glutamyl-tRNA reductase
MGETHVLNQVKQAYREASQAKCLCSEMHYLFQKSLKIAKAMRFAALNHFGKESLEKAVVDIISANLQKEERILLIGNSDINRSILHRLVQKGYCQLYLISRSHLGASFDLVRQGLPYQAIEKWGEYPAVILATVAKEPLIQTTPKNCSTRLLIDLSVPSLVSESVTAAALKKYDLKMISKEIQSRLVHLMALKEELEKSLAIEVERSIALYYLKQLKKKQLLVRH